MEVIDNVKYYVKLNKVNSKIELRFDVKNSVYLTENEKLLISDRLNNRLTKNLVLILTAGTERSQVQNKQIVVDRFIHLIQNCLKTVKTRRATKPTKSSVQKRLDKKRHQSVKKQLRNKPDLKHG